MFKTVFRKTWHFVLWLGICGAAFVICFMLPLGELERMFPQDTPTWLVIVSCLVLGFLAGVGSILSRALLSRFLGKPAMEEAGWAVEIPYLLGWLLVAGGAGNAAKCLTSSCDDLSTWSSPAGIGLGMVLSAHAFSTFSRLRAGGGPTQH